MRGVYFILQTLLQKKNPGNIPAQCTVADIHALKIQFAEFLNWL